MSLRRRSTVHDYASLRLHPDGTRVRSNTDHGHGSTSKGGPVQTTCLPRRTGHDRQENWIALDAGGKLAVKQRFRAGIHLPETTEEGQGGKTIRETEVSKKTDTIGLKDKSQRVRGPCNSFQSASEVDAILDDSDDGVKDYRAKRKRRFYEDFSFLSVSGASSPAPEVFLKSRLVSDADALLRHDVVDDNTQSQVVLPVPSSDLLKYIHYFASEYYASCGCLYNAPRETRRAHKMRKLEKLRKTSVKENRQLDHEEDELESDSSDNNSDDNDLEDSGERIEDAIREKGPEHPRNAGKRREEKPREKPRRDMYKSFDGSALMAIGMLVQEHVAGLLNAQVPENWLQEMEALEASNTRAVERRKRKQANVKAERSEDD